MFHPVYFAVVPFLFAAQFPSLAAGKPVVGFCAAPIAVYLHLVLAQPACFIAGNFTAAHTLANAIVLCVLRVGNTDDAYAK